MTVEPFTFEREVATEPQMAPLPEFSTDPRAGASLTIGAGWAGGFLVTGPQAQQFVRCRVVWSDPRHRPSYLMYEVSTDATFSEFGVKPGEYYVRIVRQAGHAERPIETAVEVFAGTRNGDRYELWNSTTMLDQQTAAAASPDNRALTFSAVTVTTSDDWNVDLAGITWTLMHGAVTCPEPPGAIPGL